MIDVMSAKYRRTAEYWIHSVVGFVQKSIWLTAACYNMIEKPQFASVSIFTRWNLLENHRRKRVLQGYANVCSVRDSLLHYCAVGARLQWPRDSIVQHPSLIADAAVLSRPDPRIFDKHDVVRLGGRRGKGRGQGQGTR